MPKPRLCDCGSCKRCKQRTYMEGWRAKQPAYNERYLARGQKLIESAKNKPCADCNKQYPHYVMDFDHRTPSEKLFSIGSMSRATKVSKLEAEIAKCDVVCANCHRARTYTRSGGHHRAARAKEKEAK